MARVSGKNSGGGDYEIPDAGSYPARCIQVVELGTHENTHPKAKKGATKEEILIVWELSETMEDGRPFVVNWRGTASIGEKAHLRNKILVPWRGKPFTDAELEEFDLANVLGAPCLLNVVHKESGEKTYVNVESIMPLPKGMKAEEAVNDLVNFEVVDYNDDDMPPKIDCPEFRKLYAWVQKIIFDSHEGKAFLSENPSFKDDIEKEREEAQAEREESENKGSSSKKGKTNDDDEEPPF